MALNFMFSAGIDIAGGDLGLEKNDLTCSVNGFLTQLFVVQSKWKSIRVFDSILLTSMTFV